MTGLSAEHTSPRLARAAVRIAAALAIVASVVVPLARKKFRLPAGATVAATAAGPLGTAVLWPRTRRRDIALFAQQMWAFTVIHELPYDDEDALRSRLRVRYPIKVDRVIGGGRLPNTRLQRCLSAPDQVTGLDRFLTWAHWIWFFEPHAALLFILLRDDRAFPRAARQMAAAYDLGCVGYFAVPTAPPWWASEQGYTGDDRVRRVMVEVGEETWGSTWPHLYNSLGGNPWAAMPSLHFGASILAATLLAESSTTAGVAGFTYAGVLGFALVYLGEHYVVDLLAGLGLVLAVRGGEPVVAPLADLLSDSVQRFEGLANG